MKGGGTQSIKDLKKKRNQELVQELKTLYGEQTCMGSENKSFPKDDDGEVSNEEREIILKVDEAVVKSSKPAIYIVGLEQNKKSIRQSLCSKEFVEPVVKECERHNTPQILQSKLENPEKDKEDERKDKDNGGTCVGVSLPECPPDSKKTKKHMTKKCEKILCKSEDGKPGRIKNKEHHKEKSNTTEEFGNTQLLDGNDNFSDNKVPSNEASNGFATKREEPNSNGLSVFPGKEAQQSVDSDKDKEDGLGLMEHKLVLEGDQRHYPHHHRHHPPPSHHYKLVLEGAREAQLSNQLDKMKRSRKAAMSQVLSHNQLQDNTNHKFVHVVPLGPGTLRGARDTRRRKLISALKQKVFIKSGLKPIQFSYE